MSLRPCVSCTRHVRSTESACPFCGTHLPEAANAPTRSIAGLGRAAIMAFGALAVSAEVGCNVTPVYGGPPRDDAGIGDAGSRPLDAPMQDAPAAEDAPVVVDDAGGGGALYGGPPPDSGAAQSDAGADTGGGIGPLYGGAP